MSETSDDAVYTTSAGRGLYAALLVGGVLSLVLIPVLAPISMIAYPIISVIWVIVCVRDAHLSRSYHFLVWAPAILPTPPLINGLVVTAFDSGNADNWRWLGLFALFGVPPLLASAIGAVLVYRRRRALVNAELLTG